MTVKRKYTVSFKRKTFRTPKWEIATYYFTTWNNEWMVPSKSERKMNKYMIKATKVCFLEERYQYRNKSIWSSIKQQNLEISNQDSFLKRILRSKNKFTKQKDKTSKISISSNKNKMKKYEKKFQEDEKTTHKWALL